jgi:hypothetical protein
VELFQWLAPPLLGYYERYYLESSYLAIVRRLIYILRYPIGRRDMQAKIIITFPLVCMLTIAFPELRPVRAMSLVISITMLAG